MIPYHFHPLGDACLLITFSHHDQEELLSHIHCISNFLSEIKHPAIIDVVPAFETIAVYYDATLYSYEQIKKVIRPFLHQARDSYNTTPRNHQIPICYDTKVAIDLHEIAHLHNLTPEEVITVHKSSSYKVAIIGFLPGFPYLTGLDERLHTPRKTTPRTKVPKGSIGIGGNYTGIYSLASPGGWNIIGQTPVQLFNVANQQQPFLFQPGDTVTFYSISIEELEAMR